MASNSKPSNQSGEAETSVRLMLDDNEPKEAIALNFHDLQVIVLCARDGYVFLSEC